jgi:hypothetical protein
MMPGGGQPPHFHQNTTGGGNAPIFCALNTIFIVWNMGINVWNISNKSVPSALPDCLCGAMCGPIGIEMTICANTKGGGD